jgi:antitoxin VapB
VYFSPRIPAMALNIKNPEVERLAAEVAGMAGETKTEAIRRALEERHARIRRLQADPARVDRVLRFLEREVWARVSRDQIGKMPGREERERILGYGQEGV